MVRDTILYDRLGLKPGCSDSEIKKAYFKKSKQWHPDKNKSEEAKTKFQEISESYEILKDKEKREMYHQVGIDILKNQEGRGGGMNPEDIFSSFFGHGMGGFRTNVNMGQRQRQDETEDINIQITVSLEDIYNGKTIKQTIKRKVFCNECDGTGNKDKKEHSCSVCNGSGQEVQVIRRGPMIQQMIQTCRTCRGSGKGSGNGDECGKCNGKNHNIQTETIEIPLPKGVRNGTNMNVRGKGNIYKNKTSNLIINIKESGHKLFNRKDNNLFMIMKIELIETVIGFERELTLLDGKTYTIRYNSGNSINNGETRVIKGKGMKDLHNNNYGDLIIQFKVNGVNIDNLNDNEKTLLSRIFKYTPKTYTQNEVLNIIHEDIKPQRSSARNRGENDGPSECVHQ
jgi:DnaJ family protein A protein 2